MKGLGVAAVVLASVRDALAMTMESTMEASLGLGMRLKSQAEIEAGMSVEEAAEVVLALNSTGRAPQLSALIRERLARGKGASLRGQRSASLAETTTQAPDMKGTGGKAPKGYEALAPATELLNGMMKEAREKLDLSQITGARFHRNQMILMREATRDVSSFNGQAAEARAQVLQAQSQIGMLSDKIPQVEGELAEHRRTTRSQIATLKFEIGVVTRDLGVVRKTLGMLKCDDSKKKSSLLQADAEADAEDDDDEDGGLDEHSLVECARCNGGKGMIMLKNAEVQPLINSLQSDVARGFVQEQLKSTSGDDGEDDDGEEEGEGVALTEEQVKHMTAIMQTPAKEKKEENKSDDSLRVEPLPVPPKPVDCAPTTACRLMKGSCGRLQDRFLLVEGGISDRLDELTSRLSKLEHYAEKTDASLVSQLASLGDQLREAQTSLAASTKLQIDSESQAALRGRQHAQLKKEYASTMTQSCAVQSEARSELCALTKIRGELYKMEGAKVFITDCAVSDWVVAECSATCGGGTRRLHRTITVAPNGGAACPPLQATEECNAQPCPVDCRLGAWRGWSSCPARCGGGVRQRSRHIKVPAKHGGEPCERTEEAEACNVQSCNRNCVLRRWSSWSTCNVACGGGITYRTRPVKVPAMGTGRCMAPNSPYRRRRAWCNLTPCHRLLPRGRQFLRCTSKMNIVIAVDSSGSLGSYGWEKSKQLVSILVEALTAEKSADIRVALLEFSSRRKTKWITHLPGGTAEKDVSDMEWFRSGTATDQALDMAGAEFLYGRPDANPVVLVITDGKPSSARRTLSAAKKLQEKAKLIWVPLGRRAPLALINRMSAAPVHNHRLYLHHFSLVTNRVLINKLIGYTCPAVK